MINTLLAAHEPYALENLKNYLSTYCPQVEIQGFAHSSEEVCQLIRETRPDLLFIEEDLASNAQPLPKTDDDCLATIILAENSNFTWKASGIPALGILGKPLQVNELLMAVCQAQQWIRIRQEQNCHKQMLSRMLNSFCPNNVVAIPTNDGTEFLRAEEIVRCEGLQKYTLIVTIDAKDLISSYNIGEFGKILLPHGFFSTHKSHLVNLRYIRKLSNEGSIAMRDGSNVPLSRRRRRSFLEQVKQVNQHQ